MASVVQSESPDQTLIQLSLARLLRQPEFLVSPRISHFLQFVVTETLAGRSASIKAFTVATAVYGRDGSFDPQTSSIVRVEALRLRNMLSQYYATGGSGDPVMISIPRGTYVPVFTVVAPPAGANDNLASATTAGSSGERGLRPRRRVATLILAASIAAGSSLLLIWPKYGAVLAGAAAALTASSGPAVATAAPPQGQAAN